MDACCPRTGSADLDPTWPTRETRLPTVHHLKIAGNAVLERTTWLGKYIPLIRVEGQRLDVNGQAKRTGMIQAGRDAQVSVDVYSTMEATAIMAAPKSPWLLYAEQISGYERFWNQANDPTLPYLLHKAVVVNGQLLPPPQRTVVEPAIQRSRKQRCWRNRTSKPRSACSKRPWGTEQRAKRRGD